MQHNVPCKFSEQYSNTNSFLASRTKPGPAALSPHFEVPDYLLWGYVKSKLYETRAVNTDDLKRQIR